MKKIYCFLLILGIFINNFPAVASAEVQTKTEEQLVVEALTNVRISDDTELVTRGEFCKIVYEIDNVDAPEATVDVFADVDMQDEYAGYIQNIYERGFVSGYGTSGFLPENKITMSEAYVVLLKMAGYYHYLDGAYPDTALRLASESGLSKGINKLWNDAVTKDTAYKLVYNLLYSKTLTKTSINTAEATGVYMTEVLGIFDGKGIVEAVDGYSLYGESVRDEITVISGDRKSTRLNSSHA